ncbi:alpha/beta hydrolase [Levilactobacillus bambusae]|uniref:Alpha/beta hydrolase n=1 Tax=Levilactobacillus bambusae TaxID=2024736 RepID=A0A2V1MXQ7_9LACO|nr:alpha/beta hydrolase [Levilactobacillus bambusae]PWF99327.1 alpha/beta hydrolase [Levilactobacillus bambusae]
MKSIRKALKVAGITAAAATGTLVVSALAAYHLATKSYSRSHQKNRQLSIAENSQANNAWYLKQSLAEWHVQSNDGLTLRATYISAPVSTSRTVILAHGLGHSREQMIPYARMFQDLGYNVLMPDARAHGDSEGTTIGYGWLDRQDYLAWIDQVIQQVQDAQIVLLGISMGAATVMAVSGETLPQNVKAVIEDSGYANVREEGNFRLWHKYHVPVMPLMPMIEQINRLDAGYWMKTSAIDELASQSKLPTLLIHGEKDQTVPVENVYTLYNALKTPKRLYVDPEAAHVMTYARNPARYQELVSDFLAPYVYDDVLDKKI